MKVAEIRGVRQAGLVDRDEPFAAGDIVKIQTRAIPMCTEWRAWQQGRASDTLGHEAIGVVVDAAESRRVAVGDRVIVMPQAGCGNCASCRAGEHIHCLSPRDLLAETGSTSGIGCYGEFLIKPDYLLMHVPEDISTRHAGMAICGLGPSFTASRRMRVSAEDVVLVSGCGAVGLGAIVNARALGARVIALELQPFRSSLAASLGATAVLDPRDTDIAARVAELTNGRGVDAAIETSNTESGASMVQQLTRPRGRIAFVSWTGRVVVPQLVGKGHEIYGCWHWNHQEHGADMMDLVRHVGPSLDLLITHTFDFTDFEDAFRVQETGDCGKILLSIGEPS